jgi:glutamate N-acetyltransferase/amino-acid N-acetyltransferase
MQNKGRMFLENPPLIEVPGFRWMGTSLGIKDTSLDFGVLASDVPCSAAAVFTRSTMPGAPILVGREHVSKGQLQAVVVNSKNANVATGAGGIADAQEMCQGVAKALGITPEWVLPSSTGVIGRRLPMSKIREGFSRIIPELGSSTAHIESFARAIMTTDTVPKWAVGRVGTATIVAVAKGSGMIEPNMATMLSYFATDAQIAPEVLQPLLTRVVNRSFNRVTVDSDTSTSDTVVLLANGQAGPVGLQEFEDVFTQMATSLARKLARDGEGATKLIELTVSGARSPEMALQVAKTVINSPLVKTAIHGADPNWGRFVMAVGKAFEYPVQREDLRIYFGRGDERKVIDAEGMEQGTVDLEAISELLRLEDVPIELVVGKGDFREVVWGCDLSREYVAINADYTT